MRPREFTPTLTLLILDFSLLLLLPLASRLRTLLHRPTLFCFLTLLPRSSL
jgi:hypothetical protein